MLSHLSMESVRVHYLNRRKVHLNLVDALQKKDVTGYVELALGITDPAGNYSAAEHNLGLKILHTNGPQPIFQLAEELNRCAVPKKIPDLILSKSLKYLKISIGSEMSMMLHPEKFWTANVRTVWAHLLIEHGDDYQKANEVLSIYRGDADGEQEMAYNLWVEIHPLLRVSLNRLHDLGQEEANKRGFAPGKLKYLWADAIANALYERRAAR